MQISTKAMVLSAAGAVSLIVLLLQQCAAKPSKLDLQTLACLENGILDLGFSGKKETLSDKAAALLSGNKAKPAPIVKPMPGINPRMGCMNFRPHIVESGYIVFQKTNVHTGLDEFWYLCVHSAHSGAPFWQSSIMEAVKNCKAPKADLAFACAVRLLSQPSIKQMSVQGLSGFIRYITPDEPVCDDTDMILPAMAPLVAQIDTEGPLRAMKSTLQECIADVSKSQFTSEKLDAMSKMEAGVKSHFGCNWFERVINKARNQDRNGNEVVQREWIAECFLKALPANKATGIDPKQFADVYGMKGDAEAEEHLNNLITGIRCSTASIATAPDLYGALAIVSGSLTTKAKVVLDNLSAYVDCFMKTFKETDTFLGDLIGCTPGVNQKEQVMQCTRAAKAGRFADDKYRLDFPATSGDMKKTMEKIRLIKYLHNRICRVYGKMKWITENPADAAKAAGKGLKAIAAAARAILFKAVFYLVVLAVFLGAITGIGFVQLLLLGPLFPVAFCIDLFLIAVIALETQ